MLSLAVQTACGEEMGMELTNQLDMVKGLTDIALAVKAAKDPQRQTTLVTGLQNLVSTLPPVIRLPLNPAFQCRDIDIEVSDIHSHLIIHKMHYILTSTIY